MGAPLVMLGQAALGWWGYNEAKGAIDKNAAKENAEKRQIADADRAEKATLAGLGNRFLNPDLADALMSSGVSAEIRRQRAKGGRASSFLTGPGGTIANRGTLLTGVVDAPGPSPLMALSPAERARMVGL